MMQDLFDCREKIANSHIRKIEIGKQEVCAFIGIPGEQEICMRLYENDDKSSIPLAILHNGSYEREETVMMHRLLAAVPENCAIIDVGANAGFFSLCYKAWFPGLELHAFEPILSTYTQLTENMARNGFLKGFYANNKGLYNETTKAIFYVNMYEHSASSMRNIRENVEAAQEECEVQTVDSYCEKINKPVGFIKCDVEGGELFVFQGAKHTLQKDTPIVFTEMLRKWSAKFGYHPNDIIALLDECGYDCYVIQQGRLAPLNFVTEETAETNYVFLHRHTHAALKEGLLCAVK